MKKRERYPDLKYEIAHVWRLKVKVILAVACALGTVTDQIRTEML